MLKQCVYRAILAVLCAAIQAATAKPLGDGTGVRGIDGIISQSGSQWLFTFNKSLADEKGAINKGDTIELLPSNTLEKITAAVKTADSNEFRLWGRLTKYEGKNYLYPIYFLSVRQTGVETEPNKPAPPSLVPVNESNDVIVIPQDVLKLLKPTRTIDLAQLSPIVSIDHDYVFSERSGFVVKENGDYIFKLDALGRNVQKVAFKILPNEILQKALAEQANELNRVRFKATGLLTKYEGNYYILLHRAVRQYTHGNFAR